MGDPTKEIDMSFNEIKKQVEPQKVGAVTVKSISKFNSGASFIWIEGFPSGLKCWNDQAEKALGVTLGEKDVRVPVGQSGDLEVYGKEENGGVVLWVRSFGSYLDAGKSSGGRGAAGGRGGVGQVVNSHQAEAGLVGRIVAEGMSHGMPIDEVEKFLDLAARKFKELVK